MTYQLTESDTYDKAHQDADDWRTREIAKDIAKRKGVSCSNLLYCSIHLLQLQCGSMHPL
ncbi:uncharacterized protein M6B38_182280 [Iris pallida]|uniref:Uncharacterized protein n=1 Tax=Iris pallida TaxID=29817 RepID=A0AAX6EM11_IRIPA|nr:uncharacterized protein M6B38_182280 [Iris pallida]